jgi:hypothetical protein
MDSKAFHICPFCQSPSPVAAPRCVRCDRALSGLPLPVYGSELDATPMRSAPADLTDLPLRDTIAATLRPDAAPVTAAAAVAGPARRRASDRGRIGRTAKVAVAAGMVGAALVGGWLVRAQDRGEPRARAIKPAPATTMPPPAAAVPSPAATLSSPAVAAASLARARASASPLPRATAAATRPASAPPAAWPQREVVPPEEPAPPVAVADDETPRPAVRRARRPAAVPIYDEADVTTVHPDVSAAPVGVERARDDFGREASPPEPEARAAAHRARLERAQQRRDVLAQRVTDLRAQTNVPVIRDVDEYQRLQQSLSAALDDLDRADAEVARLRRALRRRGE